MRKAMLLAATLAMVMLVASPAFAQTDGCPEGLLPADLSGTGEGEIVCITPEQHQDLLQASCEGLPTQEEFEACVAAQGTGESLEEVEAGVAAEVSGEAPEVGDTCPPGTSGFGDPGTGQLECLTPDELAALESESAPAVEAPSSEATVLPDTSGASLLLPASALLVGVGLVGYAVVRRR